MKSNHCFVQKIKKSNIFFFLCWVQDSPGIGVHGGYWLDFDLASALLFCWLGRERAAVRSDFLSDFIICLLQRLLALSTGYSFTVFIVYCNKWFKYRIKWDTEHFWVGTLSVREACELAYKSNWSLFCAYQERWEGKMTFLRLKGHVSTKNMKCPRWYRML